MNYEKVSPLVWSQSSLSLLDQRYLPHRQEIVKVANVKECYDAIREMVVRGAPLIGFTGIYGAILSVINDGDFLEDVSFLKEARPTAINLEYELDQCLKIYRESDKESVLKSLLNYASEQMEKLGRDNLSMAKMALKDLDSTLKKDKYNLLTICNTGYLACGPMGTALGVISHLNQCERLNYAYASETRPYLQGSRLTAYEMMTEKIPFEIIVEGAYSSLLRTGRVDAIYIGADRIVANGDTANKIGSSTLAIVAKEYGVPFYVVAPTSSFDITLDTGEQIPIEMRPEEEVTHVFGQPIAPLGAKAYNPSFDITSHKHITGIICEHGIIKDLNEGSVRNFLHEK